MHCNDETSFGSAATTANRVVNRINACRLALYPTTTANCGNSSIAAAPCAAAGGVSKVGAVVDAEVVRGAGDGGDRSSAVNCNYKAYLGRAYPFCYRIIYGVFSYGNGSYQTCTADCCYCCVFTAPYTICRCTT